MTFAQIVLNIVSIVLTAATTALIAELRKQHKESDGINVGVRTLLYNDIKTFAKTYIARGSITMEELEDLHTMHEVYHNNLDGNGYLDSVMSKVDSLPVHE